MEVLNAVESLGLIPSVPCSRKRDGEPEDMVFALPKELRVQLVD